MADWDDVPGGFKELLRYERSAERRVYYLRVAAPRLELWRVTDAAGERTGSVKEADLESADEALQLLEDIKRSLQAGGWREC